MQRATRTNLILLVTASLLGAAVYWQVGEETAGFEPPLSDLDPARIQRVAASCQVCTERRFERRDGHWQMLEPYALPADDAMVERIVGIASSPVRLRRPLSELDAGKIGLDPPLMTLELDDQHFDIGMTDALRGDRYIRKGDVVAMLPDRFSPFLAATPESELDRQLVPRGSVLERVSIDGIERDGLVDEWAAVVARRIRSAGDVLPALSMTQVELGLDDGSVLIYRLDRGNDLAIAWRTEPTLGFELDPALLPKLLGDAIGAQP
ncbi:hypothetical protein [Dokdonella sp.]|uniref:hypothetical protein n=1 Tax=Dokdonella sp. TaxID=2291710 RepID=UPI003C60BAD5